MAHISSVCTAAWQILCMYKTLLSEKTDLIFSYFDPTDVSVLTPLSLDRFYGFYQVIKLKWIKVSNLLITTCSLLSDMCPFPRYKDLGPRPEYFDRLPNGVRSVFKCKYMYMYTHTLYACTCTCTHTYTVCMYMYM